jgi:hypothetical protein
MLDNGR